MMLTIADVLSPAEVADASAALAGSQFEDGRASAGWAARRVKSNSQARQTPEIAALQELICERLMADSLFQLAVRPKRIIGPLFSRYREGDAYGLHVDEPVMDGARSDVSFTLFLSDPDVYVGGELVLMSTAGDDAIKLAAGSMVIYPATTLHRVMPVTSGERLSAVGWVRSLIRDPARRELLFELDTVRRRMFERDGPTADFDLVSKSAANLMRMWCDD